jgi:hypothetical protein
MIQKTFICDDFDQKQGLIVSSNIIGFIFKIEAVELDQKDLEIHISKEDTVQLIKYLKSELKKNQ